ncbi:hypothetical protein [Serratia proteamaculans]|uniref:hypothetical protein n=1 Tax=Serratia proteamaculans TaxID=28151 RepID=UPI0021C6369E|nr:hypothetical protein [Serratia proteamaculans]
MEEENSKITSKFNIVATCAQILLALATIYFTYTISERQNRISKLEYSPLFVLDKDQLYTQDFIPTGSDKIKITNEGYAVNNYSSDVDSILTIYYSFNHRSKTLIYKLDYFSVMSHKSGGKGEMTSGIGEYNIRKLLDIKTKTKSILDNHHPDYINFELKHIAKITYTNIEMEEGHAYFSDVDVVSQEDYDKLKQTIKNKEEISFGQLQPENLAKTILESFSQK